MQAYFEGMKTYIAGALGAGMGFALLLIGVYHPHGAPEAWQCWALLSAGLATMGVRGFMSAGK